MFVLCFLMLANLTGMFIYKEEGFSRAYSVYYNDYITFRPSANGKENDCTPIGAASNYLCVDEPDPNDGDTTSVTAISDTSYEDYYEIPDQPHLNYATINNVTLYATMKWVDSTASDIFLSIYINSTEYKSNEKFMTAGYVEYSYTWENNPGNGSTPWNWSDLDELQIGFDISINGATLYVTQVYAKVNIEWTNDTYPSSYINIFQGSHFYGASQDVGFGGDVIVNCSEIEIGDDYYRFDTFNFSKSTDDMCYYNITYWNDTYYDEGLFLEMNTTYNRNGVAEFIIDIGYTKYMMSFFVDGVRELSNIRPSADDEYHIGHTFSNTLERYAFYIDGYDVSCPTNAHSIYNAVNDSVNISWDNASYADRYVIISKTGSYPSSPTDGTEIYNNTNNFYLYCGATNNIYLSAWSYNNSGVYSKNSCKLNLPWGAVRIHVVNQSNPSQIIEPFGVQIVNTTASRVYYNSTAYDWHVVNYADMPIDQCLITLNASGYEVTEYTYTFDPNNFYNLTLKMPPIEAEGVETELYTIKIFDESYVPLSDVLVEIKRYNNVSGEYETIWSLTTNAVGETQAQLVPQVTYFMYLTRENYEQIGSKIFIPKPADDFGQLDQIEFMMRYVQSEVEEKSFWDCINFNATMFTNGSIHVFFESYDGDITNATFYTKESYNYTLTLKATNTTTSNIYSFWVHGINNSRIHKITVFINHSILLFTNMTIDLYPVYTPIDDTGIIERDFINVFGDYVPGYVNFFLIFLPCIILLVVFGPRHAGLGIIGAGCYMGFSSVFITVPPLMLVLVPVIVAIGVILIMVKEGGVKL